MNDLASIPWLWAIGWALFHSLWQGTLLALLAAVALRLARHRSAELRYALASGTLGLMVLAFALGNNRKGIDAFAARKDA